MSKAKKIISMLLAVVMILTVAPLNLLASAAIAGIQYQEASFSGDSTRFTVDTSATTEVVRVAYAEGMFTLGNTIVAATRSGIPYSDGTYANVAYAGETPETPKLVFTINGVRPDSTPTKSCSVSSVSFGDCETTVNGSSYTYTWPLSGTATAHSDLVFTITYSVSGSTYTAYAFSHVENILIMNGFVNNKINQNGTVATARHGAIVQLQSHNMYSSMCQDSIQSNRVVGFINYGTKEALSGGALLGCGSEDDLDSTINAYGASVGVALEGTKVGSLIKWNKDKSDTQFNMCYNNDSNRGESVIYYDKRTEDSLEDINLRVTLQNAEASDFGSAYIETLGAYHGHKTFGSEDANSSLTGDATSSVITLKTNAATGSRDITSSAPYGHVMATLTGTGPTTALQSNTTIYDTTSGEYKYSLIVGVYSTGNGRSNRVAGAINLDFVLYDTTDLYNLYTGILNGTGSYTIQNTTTTDYDVNGDGVADTMNWAGTPINFDKGVNPQAAMYADQTAWNNFVAAFKTAGSLLVEPDIGANWTFTNNANVDGTSNKSATAQKEIDNASYNLVVAYQALSAYYYEVDGIVNHVYKDAEGNETLLGQQVYADEAAGSTMVARYATIPGYEVVDGTPQSVLLSGKNESETLTFYYQPAKRQLVLVTNNDANDIHTLEYGAGTTVPYSELTYGTKVDFDFSHWTDANGNKITGNFSMPNENYSLSGQWIPSEIAISAIPVIDGVERTDLVENYDPIRPNADSSATPMARPADLVRDGYIFVEYYADKELTTLMTWPKNFYLHDALSYTFYARMVDVYGKIIFEPNGGTAVTDVSFTPNTEVAEPTAPTRDGYTFAGWFYDKDLTQPVTWPVTRTDNTGFIAYAKWTANDYTISFDVGKTSTKYDTKEVRAITGPAETVIPTDQYPEAPLKFGYIFDGWMLNGKRYEFEEGVTTYPIGDITLEAIWRSTEYSAFADIQAYEKLSGEYVETDKASVGDTVTFRMSTQTNFYTGSSVFVFMYDSNFFELVEEGTAAFVVNENSEYISGIDAKIQGVTDDAALPWPESIERTVTKDDGSTAYYKAMMIAIDPTISAGNYNCEPMSDGEWIVEFQLKVKAGATGSGRVYMDNAWTRNQDNIMGTMFYGWAEDGTKSVAETQNNLVTPFLNDATATITLDEEIPADITITVDANGGSWTDGTVKTYTGRAETEITDYVAPTREGYTLTVDETTGKTVWYKVNDDGSFDTSDTWAEGYYGKEAQAGLKYAAQWTPDPFDISFYVDGELKHVETVGYEEALADYEYTPAEKQGYVFAYWADAEENGNEVDFSTATCPLGGMNVYAVWEPATDTAFKIVANYTIPSSGASGSATGNFTGTTGYKVSIVEAVPETQEADTIYITLDMLPVAANGNYVYDSDNNTLPIEGVIAADGSLVLNVNYTGKPVKFTFNANGGAWADGSTTYVENGTFQSVSQGPSTTPTRAGYDFNGWASYSAGTTVMAADRTINANWTAKTCIATFNAVNSTLSGAFSDGSTVTTVEVKYGATVTAPASPSLAGYTFLGWALTDNATAAETFGKMDDENGKTYYAVYAPIDYTVTYNITWGGNYETVSDGPYHIGDTVTLRTAEEKTGYTFDGWEIDGTAAGATITIGEADVEVTGTYTAVDVDVYFDANGGFFDNDTSVTEKAVAVPYETIISKPSFTPARAGYEFLGWAETSDAGSAITSFGTVDSLTEEIRFYAVWKATYAAYTINIYMQDTTGAYLATPDQVIDTNTGLVGTEVSYTPETKTGFTLDTANSTLSGIVVGDGSLVLTVKYVREKYEVKWLNYDGSTIRTDSVYFGAALSEPEATREGYEFTGWTPSVAATMPANALEYTATYTVNYYDATFNANGGAFSNGDTTKAVSTAYGSAIVPPTDATKTGYTLSGWAYAGTTDIVISADGTTSVNMVVDGLAFDAVWKVNKYNLVYRTYNGVYETFEVEYGTAAADMPAPATAPTRTGYYFNGWSALPATMPAEQYVITSAWEKETYTLKFDTAGGNTITDMNVTYGDKITVPADPTREGYTFTGWSDTSPTNIVDLGDNGAVITYTASWTINQYTITFANTGDTTINPIKQDYNTAVTAPSDPVKEGYTFAGWDNDIPTVMPAEDTTITASWTINQYTITFVTDGGTEIAPIKQDYNTAVTAPAAPVKEGYTFVEWDKAVPTVMPAENTTITAVWAIESYTLKFDTAGGNTIADITAAYNAPIDVPADPTREGYTFTGWNKEIYTVMPDLGDNGATETFTASWSINAYSITWKIDGETYKTDENVEYGTAITAPVPTKTGYVFSGWAEEIPAKMPDNALIFTGSWNPAADTKYTVNIHTMGIDGNYVTETDILEGTTESTVYAQYTVEEGFELGANSVTEGEVLADGTLVLDVYLDRKTVTITFDSNEGSAVAPITQLYGTAVTAPADPERAGYTFGGWTPAVPDTMPSADVTIVANWNIESYTVNFLDAEDGVFATFELEYLAEIAAPANEPTKDHYTFEGWSLTKITETLNPEDLANVALIDFENAAPTVPVGGITIYPVFVRVPVALAIPESSSAIVEITSTEDDEVVVGYITGLETRLTEDVLRDTYITVEGDGRIEVTLTKFDICGTGTEVRVIDNLTDETVGIYYLVIYGDVNGDADVDATDVSMIEDEALGATNWSSEAAAYSEGNASTYDRSKVLAADINKDGKIKSVDASLLTDVTLFLAEIDQQTGDITLYF